MQVTPDVWYGNCWPHAEMVCDGPSILARACATKAMLRPNLFRQLQAKQASQYALDLLARPQTPVRYEGDTKGSYNQKRVAFLQHRLKTQGGWDKVTEIHAANGHPAMAWWKDGRLVAALAALRRPAP